jgi:hypothetical protein
MARIAAAEGRFQFTKVSQANYSAPLIFKLDISLFCRSDSYCYDPGAIRVKQNAGPGKYAIDLKQPRLCCRQGALVLQHVVFEGGIRVPFAGGVDQENAWRPSADLPSLNEQVGELKLKSPFIPFVDPIGPKLDICLLPGDGEAR